MHPEHHDPLELYRRGRQAWPELRLDAETFSAHVLGHLKVPLTPQLIASLHAEELFLACACAQGEARALELFKRKFQIDVRRILDRMGCTPSTGDEIEQKVWIRLFVGAPGSLPKIAQYSGRGSLQGWLRILAARVALNEIGESASRAIETSLAETLTLSGADPEVEYFKRLYRSEFQTAFPLAIEALSPRERSTLSQYFTDGLSIDALAALYQVHRATAARQVHRARTKLLDELRRILRERLHVEADALESILRLIESRIEIGPLSSEPDPDPGP